MVGSIEAIEYYLPETVLTTNSLSEIFPEWSVEKIDAKTGISERHIAAECECASDLAVAAAQKLFSLGACSANEIDFLLLCTQSPDYVLPTTACLLQQRLGIPTYAGALDFNLGCSGFVYGLGLADGLIQSGQAKNILLITADTYSKYLSSKDKATRTIFGDGAAATFLRPIHGPEPTIGPFVYGTDGSGYNNLIVPNSGTRISQFTEGTPRHLQMNGQRIFDFAVTKVPGCVLTLLERAELEIDDIALFIFHQANAFMLEELRAALNIPKEKFQVSLAHSANTVSSTIPIALKHALLDRRIRPGDKILLAGFGVGYSWAATIVRWARPY